MSAGLQGLWDDAVAESRRLAVQMRALAAFWIDPASPDTDPCEVDEMDLRVALALRVTEHVAHRRIRQAHIAVVDLPGVWRRLAAGELPAPWMTRILAKTTDLTPVQRALVDAEIASWDLAVTAEQFARQLGLVITRIHSRQLLAEDQQPAARRCVEVRRIEEEGVACLSVLGPVPEIHALATRLDAAARAVQAAQRRTLTAIATRPGDGGDAGTGVSAGAGDGVVPFDDGTVGRAGRAMSLAALRYAILTRSILDTGSVEVPAPRFRVGVTVPATTLLGAGDEPGLLDGTIPIPADMARSLAGGEDTWYRVLTDPITGAFLPARQERYQPTRGMLEHLRHRHGTCAVPGCARPTSQAAECDHIIEYDHTDPGRGGLTAIENLHLLCWQHHLAKTLGRLDPTRLPVPDQGRGHGPGSTRWVFTDTTSVDVPDDTDLFTPRIATDLADHWAAHQRLQRQRRRGLDRERQRDLPDDPGPPPC
ncbi:HNH endonuclease [Brachybacterium huguangmaarense]|uniref:HNH endonuclease n=1 Tax=Brachybacterium huguangmaarense TaxID=1652028 RepID=A0ABY6G1U7_9MICO|nr:HNH endonuclease signature motif containing protein [Brachybacterium huguangmaarense]UYG16648.1 HNH endonuclease [Brachybacterium huguangmaarense]